MIHYTNDTMIKGILLAMDAKEAQQAALAALNKKEEKPAKVKPSLEAAGFNKGQHVIIDGTTLTGRAKNLDGRVAQVEEITGRGFLRVTLVNQKNGELQGCLVRMSSTALIAIEERTAVAV